MLTREEVNDYIKKNLDAGYSIKGIKTALIKAKVPKSVINEVLSQNKPKNNKPVIVFGVIIIIAIITVLILLGLTKSLECKDASCLVEKANNCEKAVYIQEEDTITVKYSVKNCILTKEVIKVDSSLETPETEKNFLNKKMECVYNKGEFDSTDIEDFLNNFESCTGELKTQIELLMTQ